MNNCWLCYDHVIQGKQITVIFYPKLNTMQNVDLSNPSFWFVLGIFPAASLCLLTKFVTLVINRESYTPKKYTWRLTLARACHIWTHVSTSLCYNIPEMVFTILEYLKIPLGILIMQLTFNAFNYHAENKWHEIWIKIINADQQIMSQEPLTWRRSRYDTLSQHRHY